MADPIKPEDVQEVMKKQIAELRREMNRISKTLSERAEDAAEQAGDWYDAASDRASRTARQLRTQAQSVSEPCSRIRAPYRVRWCSAGWSASCSACWPGRRGPARGAGTDPNPFPHRRPGVKAPGRCRSID